MNTPLPPTKNTAPALALSEHDALPPGTRFGEFEILRVLGVGGFGIVYLAQDHSLERQVALKEYMPASLAARGLGPVITVRSGSFAETYAIGLRSFVNEARLLARFDHPSLVKVYRFWEDNATAYMVMPYLQGMTLRDARRAMTQPPDEAWIRAVINPMLDALELLHREGVYHRDIAPDNILLPPEGPPILLDFGAARRVISDRTQSLTAILKPSYAPIEQYAEMTQLRQGPWTDLYALGAVMHYLLFGTPPAPATARAMQDDSAAIEQRSAPGVSQRFMSALAWSLAVRPMGRPQNVAALRAALDGQLVPPAQVRTDYTVPGPTALMPVGLDDQATMRVTVPYQAPTQLDTAHMPTARMEPPAPPMAEPPWRPTQASAPPVPPPVAPPPPSNAAAPLAAHAAPPAVAAPASSKKAGVLAALTIVVLVGAGAFWIWNGSRDAGTPGGQRDAIPAPAQAASVAPPVAVAPSAPTLSVAPSGSAADAAPIVQVTPAASAPPTPELAASANLRAAAASPAAVPASVVARAKPATKASAPRPMPLAPVEAQADAGSARVKLAPVLAEPVAVAPTAAPAGPATAREACGGRVFIALAICMDRECEKPQFREHPECVKVLEMKSSRRTN